MCNILLEESIVYIIVWSNYVILITHKMQVLKSGATEAKYKFPEANPFVSEEEEGEVASVGYRYRKWNLNNGVVSKHHK